MSKQIKVTWQETEMVTTEFTQILTVADDVDWTAKWQQNEYAIRDAICDQAKYEAPGFGLYRNGEFADADVQSRHIYEVEEIK